VEDVLEDRERQILSLRDELQAVKFDLGTRQLEQEKSQQVRSCFIHLKKPACCLLRFCLVCSMSPTFFFFYFKLMYTALDFSAPGLPAARGRTQQCAGSFERE